MNLIYYNNKDSDKNIKVSLKNCGLIVTNPRCMYCEALMPSLISLDDKLKSYNDDGVSKIYNIENEVFDKLLIDSKIKDAVTGYPSIFIIKNNKLFKKYNDDRSPDNLLSFFKTTLNIKPITGRTKIKPITGRTKKNKKRGKTRRV